MKQDDAKRAMIRLWGKRNRSDCTKVHIIGFYAFLEKDHPELLKFQYRGDKYQKVMSWLSGYTID